MAFHGYDLWDRNIMGAPPYSAHGGPYQKNYGRRHRRWKRTQPSPKPVPLLSPSSSFHYDVFLNFRGEDTRKIYVGHLYRALDHKAINTFIDSEELRKGNDLSKLLKAIQESRISIVVFSENYASSTWCLKELVKILECMDTEKQIVVPIFYQLDPADVRYQRGSFEEAFAKHEQNPDLNLEDVQNWRSALTRVANLSGWDSRDYKDDGKLIEEIVEDTLNILIHISSSKAVGLVGMDFHMAEMKLRLCLGKDDVRFVGIWGMGGIGKTTIARAVYDEIACQFQHCCFLDNVKEAFANKCEVQLQEELSSSMLGKKVKGRDWNIIMEMLSKKKVLLVLDDVDDVSQIETLLGKHPLGGGSRIIITTRDMQSLSRVEYLMYNPKCLSYYEAYELFMKYAFCSNEPSGEFDLLPWHFIKYAQGLPLALKVLGASLHNKSAQEWKVALEKIKKFPQRKIQDVLRTSFDGLDDSEKDIFLDVACFFRGMKKEYATKILDMCGFFPESGLRVLVDRALITIPERELPLIGHLRDTLGMHNLLSIRRLRHRLDMHDLLPIRRLRDTLEMHGLLQEMGREIGKSSRVWNYEDFDRVVTQNTATEAVEGIVLDLRTLNVDLFINTEALNSMRKLRLLKIDYGQHLEYRGFRDLSSCYECKQHVTGELQFLSHELRCLIWHGCPLKSLPSNFHPKNLVELDMRSSHIYQLWEGTKPLEKLKSVNLSHSLNLNNIPDLSEVTNLENLNLEGCTSLFEVHPSILALKCLCFLNLKGCKGLKSLPSSIHVKSLKTLILSGCSGIQKFPEISGIMKELSVLCLDETAITELPSSIENLTGLVSLDLTGCRELKSLPDNICNLKYLTRLYLSGCSELCKLPEDLGSLEFLRELEVEGSGIEQFPSSIIPLKKQLERFSFGGYKQMIPFSSWSSLIRAYSPSGLLHLDLSDCNIFELSDGILLLSSLQTLRLCRNNFECLPGTMNQLRSLTVLNLEACKRLKSIPELSSSISYIDVHDCTDLETVSTPMSPYQGYYYFALSNCLQLVQTNLFTDIVETHHSHHQDSQLPFHFRMFLPGSRVPDWFSHQSMGSSITVQLPLNWFENEFKLPGFAICGVTNFNSPTYVSDLSAKCFCTLKGNRGDYSFGFYLENWREFQLQPGWSFTSNRFLQSDHMFLGYVPWPESIIEEGRVNERRTPLEFFEPLGKTKRSRGERPSCRKPALNYERCYTEVTFRIVLRSRGYSGDFGVPVGHHRVRSCGLRFIHAFSSEVVFSVGWCDMTEIRRGRDRQRIRSRRRKQREKDQVVTGFSWEGASSELGEERVSSRLVWQVPETMGLAAVPTDEGGLLQAVYAAACRCLGVLCPLDR